MDGRMMVGIFKRDDFGKFDGHGKEIGGGMVEVIAQSEDKLTSFGIVYRDKIEEAYQASMLITLIDDHTAMSEQARLAAVFLEIAHPGRPGKGEWLKEYLPKLKPTRQSKQPKVRVYWDKLEVRMQHLGKLGGILITLTEEVAA